MEQGQRQRTHGVSTASRFRSDRAVGVKDALSGRTREVPGLLATLGDFALESPATHLSRLALAGSDTAKYFLKVNIHRLDILR